MIIVLHRKGANAKVRIFSFYPLQQSTIPRTDTLWEQQA